MKTTVEISDTLLQQAKQFAAWEGITLDELIERGLRRVLAERGRSAFKLRRASFKGSGLQAQLKGASWEELCDRAYERRTD